MSDTGHDASGHSFGPWDETLGRELSSADWISFTSQETHRDGLRPGLHDAGL